MMDIKLLGVVLIFLSVNIQTSESCRCLPLHPQDQFCNSEIVILADVTGEIRKSGYQIQVIKVFKGSIKAKQIQYVYTQPKTSCGVTLKQSRYVLSGSRSKDRFEIGMCNLVRRWDNLSFIEKKNFNRTYKMGCSCKICRCFKSPCCSNSKEECVWTSTSSLSQENACLKKSCGTCSWQSEGLKHPVDPLGKL